MFLGLQDGTIDCFDLDRGVVSPYRIPNLWLQQEELYRKSGAPRASSARRIPICTDLKIHPIDLNLILIAHEGGISLYNLKQQQLVRSFELIIPPGAIGGNSDPNHPSVFEERHPNVNCICFRPDGLVFAAGYSDGCVAFWSIDDGELPLLVRTIDRGNVFTFDWPEPQDDPIMDAPLPESQRSREPIFKMAWSHSSAVPHDYADQEHSNDGINDGTKLIVLGGLLESDSIGLRVFHLPYYHSNNKTVADGGSMVSRTSLKDSVTTTQHSVYSTNGIADDFLMIPRRSPYFDHAEDPVAILISSTCSRPHEWLNSVHLSDDHSSRLSGRTIFAYTFPSHIKEQPRECLLPVSFDWIGSKSVVISQMFDLSATAYHSLQSPSKLKTAAPQRNSDVPLSGGHARASPFIMASLEENFRHASELITELSHQYRLLVTIHLDYKIRFWDFSLHLLLPRSSISANDGGNLNPNNFLNRTMAFDFDLHSEFPRRLEHLTVDMASLIRPPFNINTQLNFNPLTLPLHLHLNPESLDLIVILADNGCLVYQFHHQPVAGNELPIVHQNPSTSLSLPIHLNQEGGISSESVELEEKAVKRLSQSDALIDLTKFQPNSPSSTGFFPTVWIKLSRQGEKDSSTSRSQIGDQGEILYALEDIGFLAIAHSKEHWIKIIDLRKFKLLFDDAIQDESKARGKSKDNQVQCISWIVARTESDTAVLPRLLIGLSNRNFNMINLLPADLDSIDNWAAAWAPGDLFKSDHHHKSSSHPDTPLAAFTFDPEGRLLLANLASLRNALSQSSRSQMIFTEEDSDSSSVSQSAFHSILIVVCSHSVMARINTNGPQLLNRTDISAEPIVHASIMSYHSSQALLLIDQKSTCHILSLPKLELIFRSSQPIFDRLEKVRNICVDQSGDILAHSGVSTTQLTTLIYGRDAIHFPETKVYNPLISAPDPPKATDESSGLSLMATSLASNLVSWFSPNSQSNGGDGGSRPGGSRVTGVELDAILAGPQRPTAMKVGPQPPRGNQKRPKGFMVTCKPANDANARKTSRDIDRERPTSKDISSIIEEGSSNSNKSQLNQNLEGLNERGERLSLLNERFEELAHSSNQLVLEAKRLAQQQAAKSSLSVGLFNVKSLFK